MKIMIAGGDGQVGREFHGCADTIGGGFEILSMNRQQLDITKKSEIISVVDTLNPAVIVNAAAYTAVDKAEEESELAFAVNRDGAGTLAEVCARKNIPLVHISTDYVFDGKKVEDYVETDDVNPLSVYGQSKLEGEQQVQQFTEKHIILRTSWVFGPFGRNFVYTMVRMAKQRKELRVVDDQYGCPTAASSIANAILAICNKISGEGGDNWGIFHFCGSPKTTWYGFSNAIIENTRMDRNYIVEKIVPVATSEYPTAAIRPQNSGLNCDKIHRQFEIDQQSWLKGLQEMVGHPQFLESSAS